MPGRVLPSWPIMEKRSKCQKHVDSIYDIVKELASNGSKLCKGGVL